MNKKKKDKAEQRKLSSVRRERQGAEVETHLGVAAVCASGSLSG